MPISQYPLATGWTTYDAQREYGVRADGTTDDSAALQAAIDAAAVTRGRVDLPAGTIIASGIQIKTGVYLVGHGPGATVIKLKSGANADLLTVANFTTLAAGTTQGGALEWGLRDLTLDGNKDNNSSGWAMRVYGAAYSVDNVEVQNGKSGGVFSQWGTGGTDMEAHYSGFRIHDCAGNGLDWHGPHDSVFVNGHIFKNVGVGVHTVYPSTSDQFANCHTWGTEHTIGWHFEAPAYVTNSQAEGASTANVVFDCNSGEWIGGAVFGTDTGAEVGLQFGLNSTARYWQVLGARLHRFSTTGIPVKYVATAGNQVMILFEPFPSEPAVGYSGSLATYDDIEIRCPQTPAFGAAWTRRVSTGGELQFYNAAGNRSMTVKNTLNEAYLQIKESSTNNNASNDCARLMVRDNGSGKTQLIVRFATGAIQVLSTEP